MDKTVLVTGGTGYIGSWVVKKLLEKGYTVRATVRNLSQQEKYAHLQDVAERLPGDLQLYEADLLKQGSYDEAARGCEAIFHIASPFTLRFKDPQKELIEPAVEGTRNVLSAASASGTVKKVILTSSVAAICGDNADMKDKGLHILTEDDFNDTSNEKHQPYSYSKVMAELAAWDEAKSQQNWELVVMNPAFVMGPMLSKVTNTGSIQFMQDMLSGKFLPGAPDLEFGYVDVRDVADAHILALENDAKGRHILSVQVMKVMELANIIRALFPGKYNLPLMTSPKFMLYLVGWAFGLTTKFITRNINHPLVLDNSKSLEKLGLNYTPIETTVKDMVIEMQQLGLAKS